MVELRLHIAPFEAYFVTEVLALAERVFGQRHVAAHLHGACDAAQGVLNRSTLGSLLA